MEKQNNKKQKQLIKIAEAEKKTRNNSLNDKRDKEKSRSS